MANIAEPADHLRTTLFGPDAEARSAFRGLLEMSDRVFDARLAARLIGSDEEKDAAFMVLAHAMAAFEAYCMGKEARFRREVTAMQGELLRNYRRGVRDGCNTLDDAKQQMAHERGRKTCYVYFIKSAPGEIKIGKAIDVQKRLNGLQTSHPHRLQLLATTTGGKPAERAYHERFAEHRLHGEWFSPHPDILAEIERLNT